MNIFNNNHTSYAKTSKSQPYIDYDKKIKKTNSFKKFFSFNRSSSDDDLLESSELSINLDNPVNNKMVEYTDSSSADDIILNIIDDNRLVNSPSIVVDNGTYDNLEYKNLNNNKENLIDIKDALHENKKCNLINNKKNSLINNKNSLINNKKSNINSNLHRDYKTFNNYKINKSNIKEIADMNTKLNEYLSKHKNSDILYEILDQTPNGIMNIEKSLRISVNNIRNLINQIKFYKKIKEVQKNFKNIELSLQKELDLLKEDIISISN